MFKAAKFGEQNEIPEHLRETFIALNELHATHERNARPFERGSETASKFVSAPAFLISLASFVALWIAINLLPPSDRHFDPPPFAFLDTLLTLVAVCISLVIAIAQRRASVLADMRAQMTLQHAILAENKIAKAIQLLGELRRDDPMIEDRPDREAEAMAKPTDPNVIIEAIADTDKIA